MKKLLRAFCALAFLVASPAPALAQMRFSNPASSGAAIICQSAVAQSVTGTLTETTLATCTLPAGAMGANGQVVIESLWSYTNSANTKTLRVKFGGTAYFGASTSTTATFRSNISLANRNSTSSQVGAAAGLTSAYGSTTTANTTSAVDTTAAVNITFTGQLTNTGETITLETYRVILHPKS